MMKNDFFKALAAEFLKARRTKNWLTAIFCGAILPIMHFLLKMMEDDADFIGSRVPDSFFLVTFDLVTGFSLVFLPMSIALFTAQIASIEHKNTTWQLIETQPLARWSIYLAKFFKVLLSVLSTIIVFFVSSYLLLWVMHAIKQIDVRYYTLEIPYRETALYIINLFLGALSTTTFLYIVNLLVKKNNLVSTTAVVSILGYSILKGLQFNISPLVPIVQLDNAASGLSEIGNWVTFYARLSLVMSLILLPLGYIAYAFRNYGLQVFKLKKAVMPGALLLVIGAALCYLFSLPKMQVSYGKTILAGKISSETPIKSMLLMDVNERPIAMIPVDASGEFHIGLDSIAIEKGHYFLYLTEQRQGIANRQGHVLFFYMANNDSIHADIRYEYGKSLGKYTGDRRAESQLRGVLRSQSIETLNSKLEYSSLKSMSAVAFSEQLEKAWEADKKRLIELVTADGYRVANDVVDQQITILNLRALGVWNVYQGYQRKENVEVEKTPFVDWLASQIPANNPALLDDTRYLAYVYEVNNEGKREIKDLEKLSVAEKIQEPRMREALFYDALMAVLSNYAIEDTLVLSLAKKYESEIKQNKFKVGYKKGIKAREIRLDKEEIPDFSFIDEKQVAQSLKQFLGSYVVLDVWATWCTPCKENAPYFYDYAEKYQSTNIKFVAISVDQNIDDWLLQKTKNPHIINWITSWDNPFMNHFGIDGIPRYILLDPTGSVLSASLPQPRMPEFGMILDRYLSSL